jgi:hypothetical protein
MVDAPGFFFSLHVATFLQSFELELIKKSHLAHFIVTNRLQELQNSYD